MDEIEQVVDEIARQLGETERKPVSQIKTTVELVGADKARSWATEALTIHAGEGMLTKDGSRPRTPGGIFFQLVRMGVSHSQRKKIFPYINLKNKHKQKKEEPPVEPLTMDILRAMVEAALSKQRGEVSSVKINLVGRPGEIEERPDFVVLQVDGPKKLPNFPKGLPPLPDNETSFTVFIASKQWRKVQNVLDDEDDRLIIEGLVLHHAELGRYVVYTTSVTTKSQQAAKRSEDGETEAAPEAPKEKKQPAADGAQAKAAPAPQKAAAPANSTVKAAAAPRAKTLPPNAGERLTALRAQEAEIQTRLDEIKASGKPGAFTVMRELWKVQEEIKELEG